MNATDPTCQACGGDLDADGHAHGCGNDPNHAFCSDHPVGECDKCGETAPIMVVDRETGLAFCGACVDRPDDGTDDLPAKPYGPGLLFDGGDDAEVPLDALRDFGEEELRDALLAVARSGANNARLHYAREALCAAACAWAEGADESTPETIKTFRLLVEAADAYRAAKAATS